MGRLIAIILGGAALALYLPVLLPNELESVAELWKGIFGEALYENVTASAAGLFAGLALVLLAIRGKE